MKSKLIHKGIFYIDTGADYFCSYQDGMCMFEVAEYYGLKHKKDLYMNNLEEPCIEEPIRIVICGCDDTIYVKRFSSFTDYEYQKLLGILKSNKILNSKKLIEDFNLIRFN